jgi:hypothetical protein
MKMTKFLIIKNNNMNYVKIIIYFILLVANMSNFKHFWAKDAAFGMAISFIAVISLTFGMYINFKKIVEDENN